MITSRLAVLAAAVAVAGPVAAQEFVFEGYLELEYLNIDNDDEVFFFGDVDGSYGFGSGFGLDFGAELVTDGDDSFEAIYLAGTWAFGPGKISAGIPRSAYDTFSNRPALGGQRFTDFALDEVSGGLVENFYLLDATGTPFGLRYDGDYDPFKIAVSVHRFDENDVDAFAFAARYDFYPTFAILGDFERLDGNGFTVDTTRLGAEQNWGVVQGGLAYFNRDIEGAPHVDGTEAWLDYTPTQQITVSGTALNTNVIDVYGLSLEYQWPIGAYAQIGVVDGRSIDAIYDISIGWEF